MDRNEYRGLPGLAYPTIPTRDLGRVATLARDDHTLLTDPETTQGVPFRRTTWDVPGGPRDRQP